MEEDAIPSKKPKYGRSVEEPASTRAALEAVESAQAPGGKESLGVPYAFDEATHLTRVELLQPTSESEY